MSEPKAFFEKFAKSESQNVHCKKATRKLETRSMLCYASTEKFYSHPEWRSFRLQILKKNGSKCQACGVSAASAVLHVDHIKARSKCPELSFEEDNMQVLCEACNLGKGTKPTRFKKITKDSYHKFSPQIAPFLKDLPPSINAVRRAALFLKESLGALPLEYYEALATVGFGKKDRKNFIFALHQFSGACHRAGNLITNSELASQVKTENEDFQKCMEDPEATRLPKGHFNGNN